MSTINDLVVNMSNAIRDYEHSVSTGHGIKGMRERLTNILFNDYKLIYRELTNAGASNAEAEAENAALKKQVESLKGDVASLTAALDEADKENAALKAKAKKG